jgi:hypothetical protein
MVTGPVYVSPRNQSVQVPSGRYTRLRVAPCSTTGATSNDSPNIHSLVRFAAVGSVG